MPEVKYIHDEIFHNTGAASEIFPVLFRYFKPKSVLDVGCGIGTWLEVLDQYGITDYFGIDADYVQKKQLHIPIEKFMSHDLEKPFDLKRKFDLVISMEVAEHLSESVADSFVESLVRHSSVIMFSAAIPYQEGQNHINLQWPDYWINKFKKHGYVFSDAIRNQIWNNSKIDWCYRQNIFLFFDPSKFQGMEVGTSAFSCVHPDLWKSMNRKYQNESHFSRRLEECENGKFGIKLSYKILMKALKIKLNSIFRN